MKGRGAWLILATGILLVGIIPRTILADETGVEPPETSYSDQWADLEQQSTPFLNLRNDSPAGTISTPETPDTPGVEAVTIDGETVVVEAPDGEETPDTSEAGASEPADTIVEPPAAADTAEEDVARSDTGSSTEPGDTRSDTAPEPAETSDTGSETRMVEENEDSAPSGRTAGAPDEDRKKTASDSANQTESPAEPADTSDVRTARDRSPGRRAGSLFDRTSPLDTGPVLFNPASIDGGIPSGTAARGTIRSDFSPLGAVKYPRNTVPFWWRYYWWIVGGLVVTVTIGMFFWFRRRRVEVVDSSYPSADAFFQEQLKRKRNPTTPEESARSAYPDEAPARPSGTAAPEPSPSSEAGFNHRELAERLREKGYEGEFEQMLKLYYEENMTEEQIAERISRGAGAVGLVLDYADRLRKEMNHGKRA